MSSESESTKGNAADECACGDSACCGGGLDRRTFIQVAGAGAVAVSGMSSLTACAGLFASRDTDDHFIPVDKKLSGDWVASLFERGGRNWVKGQNLETVGMPVGGICAGQVYLTGDGRLYFIDIFNQYANTGYGSVNYREGRTASEMVVNTGDTAEAPSIDQGFAIKVETGDQGLVRSLDSRGFPDVRFCGEYPIGEVEFSAGDFPSRGRNAAGAAGGERFSR